MKKTSAIILIAATIIMVVVGYIVLPSDIAIQIGINGDLRYAPKLVALIIPLGISLFGVYKHVNEDDDKNQKGLITSIVGILLIVVEIVMNIKK